MINVISFYKLYKKYKFTKIKQIYGYNNLANLIIKIKVSLTLKIVIDTNYINLNIIK